MTVSRIHLDDTQLRAYVREAQDQWPFAFAVGANRTAEDALVAMRQAIPFSFIVRRPEFLLPPRELPREWRATKQNLSVRIAIGDGGPRKLGDRRRAILEKFERGGVRFATEALPLAIPTTALRPVATVVPPQSLYPRNLVGVFTSKGEFRNLGRKAGVRKRRALGSTGRYFVLGQSGDRYWGLYQRLDERRIVELWAFRLRIPIPVRLGWVRTVTETIQARIHDNMTGAIELALRTRK